MHRRLTELPRDWALVVLALLIAALAVTVLGPWKMATNPLIRDSTSMYSWVDEATSGWSAQAGTLTELVTEGLLVVLAGLLALTVWWARADIRVVAVGVAGAAGFVGSAASTLVVKAMIAEPRPCEAVPDMHALSECPPIGDWSFPSNHSGMAAALATAVVLAGLAAGSRRTWLMVVAVLTAVVTAALRVVSGVHYPHDVVAGLVFGASITVAVTVVLAPVAVAVLARVGLGGRGEDPVEALTEPLRVTHRR